MLRALLLLTCIAISSATLTGCQHRPPEAGLSAAAQVREKPRFYPAMDSFQLDDFSFGFALKLSDLPAEIQETPHHIDIAKTIHWNMGYADGNSAEKIQAVLESLKSGRISSVSVNGLKDRIFSLTGKTRRLGSPPHNLDVTYSIETTNNLEMLSLKKETRYSSGYLRQHDFNKPGFVARLVKVYGNPDYTHHRSNNNGIFSHYWWGADEVVLLSGKDKSYDYLNASHWNGYRGKTFFVSIHKYSSGDIVIGEILNDNLKAFQNHLGE